MKETFLYDPTSPSGLVWARNSFSGKLNKKLQSKLGEPAGSLNQNGQYEVWYEGRLHQCHRIVYELCVGEIPEGMFIDHIDGNRANNCIENLRVVDFKINARNRKKSSKNTTGVTGVYPDVNSRTKQLLGYVASWQNLDGTRSIKRFPLKDYGEDCIDAARWWRELMIDFLNADGAGYTDDHGKR